jgi:PHD/YefM family antitoxin component YafN of YafNO toxin-antitoxin module
MKYGHPVMVVLSIDQFEGMLETIEILSDNSLIERLQKSIEDARAGKSLSMDEAQARLIPESK